MELHSKDKFNFIDFAPKFTQKQAESLAEEWYGKNVSAKPLPSERDQNFLLKDKYSEEKYVLKIANKREKKEILELQNLAMKKIGSYLTPLSCPQICLTTEGKETERIGLRNGEYHYVRMVTYIKGVPLGKVHPHNPYLLCSIGRFIAKIDTVLKDLSHSASHRDFHWDLQNGPQTVQRFIKFIENPDKRFLLEYFLDRFQSQASKFLSGLNKTVIHNDGNDQNILINISDNQRNGEKQKMSLGIIDFGDMVFSYTVNDIAVASAYVMLHKKNFMEAASHMIKGYNEIINLTNREFKAIPHLIYMRLCMSVAISAFQKRQNPENKYLTISEEGAWKLLKRLKKSDLNFMNFISK